MSDRDFRQYASGFWSLRRIVGAVVAGIVAIVVVSILGGSFYTIDEGDRGVILRNGSLVGTAQPGLGWKTPWIEDVRELSVRSTVTTFDKAQAYSEDQQAAEIRISVNWRPNDAEVAQIYARYQTVENMFTRLVQPKVYENMKVVFGRYTAVTAIQQRARLNQEVRAAIESSVSGPVIIENIQIENIEFSDTYIKSIEDRMRAEVLVLTEKQNLAREKIVAERTVTFAQGAADSRLAQAKAEAEAIRLRGGAEAEAISARAKALGENPSLVSLTQAERWDGRLPTSVTTLPTGTTSMLIGLGAPPAAAPR